MNDEQEPDRIDEFKDNLNKVKDDEIERLHFIDETILSLSATEVIIPNSSGRKKVEIIVNNCRSEYEQIDVLSRVYDHLLRYQLENNKRIHKGSFLVFLANHYWKLGYKYISKRYLMLTLIEDALLPRTNIENTGSYPRLLRWYGLTDKEIKNYVYEARMIYKRFRFKSRFPEWVLQDLDSNWLNGIPIPDETILYPASKIYVNLLLGKLGQERGKGLERLAEYILSCIPGFRTKRNQKTHSTEYDVVCTIDGSYVDFRSELGRYFICECKDWKKPVNFTSVAKFAFVLDSVKSRFGIIFSREGITGQNKNEDAERAQFTAFHNRGIAIVVIDQKDLEFVASGYNFIALLREKYERIRLDIRSKPELTN
jgi:hypothetical protein